MAKDEELVPVRLTWITLASLFGVPLPATAQQAPTLEGLWEIIQQQQLEIEALQRQVSATQGQIAGAEASIEATQDRVAATAEFVDALAVSARRGSDTSIGGYGELHYNRLDADDPARDLDQVDFHRFVLTFAHEFDDRIRFFSELELEHSLSGDGLPGEVTVRAGSIAGERHVGERVWGWSIFPRGFEAPGILEQARLQTWTLKPATRVD